MFIIGLFFNPETRTGGHKRYFELLTGLASRGHRVLVFHDPSFPLPAPLESAPLPSVKTPFKSAALRYRARMTASRSKIRALSSGCDKIVVFGETHFLAAKMLRSLSGGRLLCAIRSNPIEEFAALDRGEARRGIVKRLKKMRRWLQAVAMERMVARGTDDIVLQSDFESSAFLARNPKAAAKTKVIRNNITASWFAPEYRSANRSASLEKLLFIGSLNVRKGILYLLEAFSSVASDYPLIALDIVGFGVLEERIASFIVERGLVGRVRLLGRRRDVFPSLVEADLLVVPSLYDSYPNVVLEALHTGTPVIGSRCGGIPEMLREPELLFEGGSSAAIETTLRSLLAHPESYAAATEACRKRAEYFMFDWVAAFESVLQGRGATSI